MTKKNPAINTNIDRVYKVIQSKGILGLSRAQLIQFRFSGMSTDALMSAVRSLRNAGKVIGKRYGNSMHFIDANAESGKEIKDSPFAASRTFTTHEPYVPPKGLYEIARPSGNDHKKHGSLQADGSVKSYGIPVAMCVGFLKDKTSNARG